MEIIGLDPAFKTYGKIREFIDGIRSNFMLINIDFDAVILQEETEFLLGQRLQLFEHAEQLAAQD
jgi:hypothetical protein